MKSLAAVLLLFLTQSISAQTITRLDGSKITSAQLDAKIKALMQAANVHGLGISIFNNNKVVYEKAFGYKNFEKKELLTTKTNIYGASLSKAVFAVLVMKLAEEGKLNLDRPLQEYLPKPIYDYEPKTKWHDNYAELKEDALYQKITARMCLDHTTGFPNWRWYNPDHKLKVATEPGTVYSYSGEGMVYLQVVLEHYLGKSLEELMQEKIFRPLGMKHSSYTWQPEYESDFSYGHQSDGSLYQKDKDNEARAASTLETTLDDYTMFTKAVLNNTIISKGSRDKMFTPQIRLHSVSQFGPKRFEKTDKYDAIKLSYGLGWGLLQSPYGTGAFKEGHGDGFQHYSILFPEKGTGIVIMSNSDNAESIFTALLELTIADTFTPWEWENYIPYDK